MELCKSLKNGFEKIKKTFPGQLSLLDEGKKSSKLLCKKHGMPNMQAAVMCLGFQWAPPPQTSSEHGPLGALSEPSGSPLEALWKLQDPGHQNVLAHMADEPLGYAN